MTEAEMTDAQKFLALMDCRDTEKLRGLPRVIRTRFQGSTGRFDRRTGRKESRTMYQDFEDGSRLRTERGGEVTALEP